MGHEKILEKDTMIVSETDEKGIIVYANEDFCKVAGYTKEELIGNPHNMVRHEDMPKQAFESLWKTLKRNETWHGIVKNKTKDGGFYWVNATVYPSVDKDGKKRFISVRVKPTKDEITKALSTYNNYQRA